MNLLEALRLKSGEAVAFVGGGGKTTAMFRLADEIVREGGRVITTTTTKIFAAQTRLAQVHVQSLSDLLAAVERHPHVLWTGEVDAADGKAYGVDPASVETLRAELPEHIILIEADGSRMRPFKAPGRHEPVIPACVTLAVLVVGIDALGLPVTSQFVHRPEQIAAIWPGEVVTAEMIARVLVHPAGGRKNVPTRARMVALITKVAAGSRNDADQLARLLKEIGDLDAVVLAMGRAGEVGLAWEAART